MVLADVWKILEIEPTKDEEILRNAYRTKVVKVNPEDDPEGFKQLREAYELAVCEAQKPDSADGEGTSDAGAAGTAGANDSNKSDVDKHIDKAAEIYADIDKRIDVEAWKEWLDAPICLELDTADLVREKLLAFSMEHYLYPHTVWKLFNDFFRIEEEKANLIEMFPEDYINFVIFKGKEGDFSDLANLMTRADFDRVTAGEMPEFTVTGEPGFFEPEDYSTPIDNYIKELNYSASYVDRVTGVKYLSFAQRPDEMPPQEDIDRELHNSVEILKNVVEYLDDWDYVHPKGIALKIRALYFDGRGEEAAEFSKYVLTHDIFEQQDAYLNSTAILVLLATSCLTNDELTEEQQEDIQLCEDKVAEMEQEDDDRYFVYLAKGLVKLAKRDYKKSSEIIIKACNLNARNNESVMFLKMGSRLSDDYYARRMESGEATNREKLDYAWSAFRLENIEKTFEILKTVELTDEIEFDYYNIYGRNYYNSDQFEQAYPYVKQWNALTATVIDKKNNGEELDEQEQKHYDRRTFCDYIVASCAEKLENYEEAEQYYEKCLATADDTCEDINEKLFYYESYGKMLAGLDRHADAMKIWNIMIDSIEHCIPGFIHRQESAYELRDAQLVIDDYYSIIRDFPQYARAYVLAADVFMIYNQREDVESVFARAEAAGVESDNLSLLKARHLARKGESQEAYELYKEIEKNLTSDDCDLKDKAEFYTDIVALLMNMRDEKGNRCRLGEAEEYVKAGQQIDNNNKRLLWQLTDILEWTNRTVDDVYKRMLELYPDDDMINLEYGEYLKRMDDKAGAMSHYYECLKKNPENGTVQNKLMNMLQDEYADTEDRATYDQAVSFANGQLEINDDDFYRIERALLYIDGFDLEKAHEDARTAVEMNGENVYAHNAVGLSLLRQGKAAEAVPHFEKAIVLEEESKETPSPFVNCAKAYEYLHEFDKAIEKLSKAIEIFGENVSANESILGLYIKKKDYNKALTQADKMISYYRNLKLNSGNKWNDRPILKYKLKRVEIGLLSQDDRLTKAAFAEVDRFLQKNGYLDPNLGETATGSDRERCSCIFGDLADFYKDNVRDFEKAYEYYKLTDLLSSRVEVEEAGASKGIFSAFNKKKPKVKITPQEEFEDRKYTLGELGSIYIRYASMCYRLRKMDECEKLIQRAELCFNKGYGSIEKYLEFMPYYPSRAVRAAMFYFLKGDKDKAMEYVASMGANNICSFCRYGVCYEEHLIYARMYDMLGECQKANECYRKAFELSLDDTEAFVGMLGTQNKR